MEARVVCGRGAVSLHGGSPHGRDGFVGGRNFDSVWNGRTSSIIEEITEGRRIPEGVVVEVSEATGRNERWSEWGPVQ
jgi:hypothetical protein